jgi:hypothetical protein
MAIIDPGQAGIHPLGPVIAGSFTTINFTYTAGHPIDDSGYVLVAFRSVGDFGTPQFDEPGAPNYCSVSTTGDCHIEPRWDPKGYIRPWSRALYLKIRRGFLNRGEQVIVVFGDTGGGSPGWQVQTNCVNAFEFKTFVDPIATYRFKELLSSPNFPIVAGKPMRAVCVAPSQVKVNQSFTYHLKLEDCWGNPTGIPQAHRHPGWDQSGVHTITAKDEQTNLGAISNPIAVCDKIPLWACWADFHGQSGETVGDNTIEDYFAFARDYGLLDIAAHSGNDFQVSDEFWEQINQVTAQFYQPGCFVTFPGYEWSGNTPLGGDRNVFFFSEGGSITRSSGDLLPGGMTAFPESPTASALFENLSRQDDPKPFTFAHVGGRYADIRMHDPEIELAVEVHSAWGTFEWLVEQAIQLGYRIGICANSDGHKGRPGASYPGAGRFGSLGGLTCVLVKNLDREHVFQALKARHFYATTGNRPLLDVRLDLGDERCAMMGDIVGVGKETPNLAVKIVGSAPIECVEIRNGLDVIRTQRPYGMGDLGRRIKIVWCGAEVRGRDRMTIWDGGLQVAENKILAVDPINFWNANQPLEWDGHDRLTWKSVTTGGLAGLIITLENAGKGNLSIHTTQGENIIEIASLGLEPVVWDFGGLRKEIRITRLPDQQPCYDFSFHQTLKDLVAGDNPIYICMTQEDGHMAWSSPIYLNIPKDFDN